jgi:hypothetical protein
MKFAIITSIILMLIFSAFTSNQAETNADNNQNQSRFGLDYVFGLDPQYTNKPYAKLFRDAGLSWVNFADIRWKNLEPRPPVNNKHNYQWFNLDML